MLSIAAAKKIGINACINKLGREFVLAHRNSSTSAFGENDGGVFCFVGIDDNPRPIHFDGTLTLDSASHFPYFASCIVDLSSGATDCLECVIPSA